MNQTVKEIINAKVPESLQTKEFSLMISLIKEHKFNDVDQLKTYVDTNIGTLKVQLKEKEADSSLGEERRKIAKEIDILKSIKTQFFRFL